MNACKHRKICEATRDCLRLRPKGKQSGSGPSTWPDANTRTAGVKSEPKSSCDCCGTWKRCGPRPAVWTDFTVRRVRRRSIGMTEEANVSGNALDMPTSVWSEMTRKQVEPLIYRTANDGQRQLADASGRTALEQYGLRLPANYRQAVRKRAAGQ